MHGWQETVSYHIFILSYEEKWFGTHNHTSCPLRSSDLDSPIFFYCIFSKIKFIRTISELYG